MTIKRVIILAVILFSLGASFKKVTEHISNKDSHDFLSDYAILVIESDGWDIDWKTRDSIENNAQKENLKKLLAVLEGHRDVKEKSAIIQTNFSDSFFLHKDLNRKDFYTTKIFRAAISDMLIAPELFLESYNISSDLLENIKEGFSAIFGYEPVSVSISNLELNQSSLNKLSNSGIVIVQNYSMMSGGEGVKVVAKQKLKPFFHSNGSPTWENQWVMGLSRNVHFEPFYEGHDLGREQAVKAIERLWKNNSFVILSTHRTNFAQIDANRSEFALSEFDKLLEEAATIAQGLNKKLLFMDNREIARAIANRKVE